MRTGSLVKIIIVRYSVKNLPSVAIYDETGKLVSWAFTGPYGAANALFTQPWARGRGLGVLTMKAISRNQAQEADFIPMSRAEKRNGVSVKVMEKAGFRYADDVYWIVYEESRT